MLTDFTSRPGTVLRCVAIWFPRKFVYACFWAGCCSSQTTTWMVFANEGSAAKTTATNESSRIMDGIIHYQSFKELAGCALGLGFPQASAPLAISSGVTSFLWVATPQR